MFNPWKLLSKSFFLQMLAFVAPFFPPREFSLGTGYLQGVSKRLRSKAEHVFL